MEHSGADNYFDETRGSLVPWKQKLRKPRGSKSIEGAYPRYKEIDNQEASSLNKMNSFILTVLPICLNQNRFERVRFEFLILELLHITKRLD